LINRDDVFDAALEIIDRDGVDALSMRTLANAMKVNAASFYYHFKNKDEILDGVANLVLKAGAVALDRNAVWQDQMVEMFLGAAEALDQHPNIAPVLIRRSDRSFAKHVHNHAAQIIRQAGMPPDMIVPLLDSQEALLIGMAVLDSNEASAVGYDVDADEFPALHEAIAADRMDRRRRRELAARALLAGWSEHANSGSRRSGAATARRAKPPTRASLAAKPKPRRKTA
jgi:AcrR family transcriptional regulator